jgi:hypothetical protein
MVKVIIPTVDSSTEFTYVFHIQKNRKYTYSVDITDRPRDYSKDGTVSYQTIRCSNDGI